MKIREITTVEISILTGINPIGKGLKINGLNLCNRDSQFDSIISYITSEKLFPFLHNNIKIKAVFLTPQLFEILKDIRPDLVYFPCPEPESAFYKLHISLVKSKSFYDPYDFESQIGENCNISSKATIERGSIIGENVTIRDFSVVKKGSVIGNDTYVGYGSIIGSEGFQDVKIDGVNTLIPHVAGCKIGSDVSIFDNTCICNSLFEDTTAIGNHTKIDNLVHIAHNCIIGSNCTIAAGSMLCGSTIMEDNVWLAPNTSILNKVRLAENSMVGLGAVVIRNVEKGDTVVGNPSKSIKK